MRELIYSRESLVWLTLTLITLFSWLLGSHHGLLFSDYFLEGAVILLLAFYKVRLVIMYFMEVGEAPLTLRLSAEAWVIGSCAAILLASSGIFTK